jgi:hypothetical protein
MNTSVNDSIKLGRKKLQSISREINLNDMHYCNLQAIIEAETGRGAVEQYIQDRKWQVLRNDLAADKEKKSKLHKPGLSTTIDIEPDSGIEKTIPGLNDLKITEQKFKTGNTGLARNNPDIFQELEMARFKISSTSQPDKYVWVYRMGKHWVICN